MPNRAVLKRGDSASSMHGPAKIKPQAAVTFEEHIAVTNAVRDAGRVYQKAHQAATTERSLATSFDRHAALRGRDVGPLQFAKARAAEATAEQRRLVYLQASAKFEAMKATMHLYAGTEARAVAAAIEAKAPSGAAIQAAGVRARLAAESLKSYQALDLQERQLQMQMRRRRTI